MSAGPSPRDIAMAGGGALCAALIAALALGTLASPEDFNGRLSKIEQTVQTVRGQISSGRKAAAMRPGTLCTGDRVEQAARLRDAIGADAAALNLTIGRMDVGAASTSEGPLGAIRLQFEATGSYEAALTLLERLDQLRPQIFADAVDLKSNTSSVAISFSGRAYCVL